MYDNTEWDFTILLHAKIPPLQKITTHYIII